MNPIDLYALLPAVYRIRDAEQGGVLEGLLDVVSAQANVVKDNIDDLYSDFFIETCLEWVVPYIGQLVANRPIAGDAVRSRADVANTIYYRQRKGTLTGLEQLANDVTGWPVHAVAFMELLSWSQNLNHRRFEFAPNPDPDILDRDGRKPRRNPASVWRVGTVNLRDTNALELLDGAFDGISHTIDVRSVRQKSGWYNVKKIGFFAWRLQPFPMRDVPATVSSTQPAGFHFSPLGNPAPIFTNPVPRKPDALSTEINVPTPLRARAFHAARGSDDPYYFDYRAATRGGGPSFAIYRDNVLIPDDALVCMDLRHWAPPAPGPGGAERVGVDLYNGRICFQTTPAAGSVVVAYTYGFNAPMGGGPYDRRRSEPVEDPAFQTPDTVADPSAYGPVSLVQQGVGPSAPAPLQTISSAVLAWKSAGSPPPRAVIQIQDNGTYTEDLVIDASGGDLLLVIQAANLRRPVVRGNVYVSNATGTTTVILDGLLIAGSVRLGAGAVGLTVRHSTLVPGQGLFENGGARHPELPSVLVAGSQLEDVTVAIEQSITGPLIVPDGVSSLSICDSIVDAVAPDARGTLTTALVSTPLTLGGATTFVSAAQPTVRVTIGVEGPYVATLARGPNDVADAAALLQAAIAAAHPTAAFSAARVIAIGDQLVVIPGEPSAVLIEPAELPSGLQDPTAIELGLDPASASLRGCVVGGSLTPFPSWSFTPPSLSVSAFSGANPLSEEAQITLSPAPTSVGGLVTALIAALASVGTTSPAIGGALVGVLDDRVVVVSGPGATVTFGTTATDCMALGESGLGVRSPAVAGSLDRAENGAATDTARSTFLGDVVVGELRASESIFQTNVEVKRTQSGCVRFSFVPPGSRTPRRYRCQPDLAISRAPAAAAPFLALRIVPELTSDRYGDPGFAQLTPACAIEIRTGAEDGAEMGAFHDMQQAQRANSLQVRLDEYLPFGLEAGLVFMT